MLFRIRPLAALAFALCSLSTGALADFDAAERAYERGDFALALKEYRADGSPRALNSVGLMYFHGEGVPRDPQEAMASFRKGAELGNADAQRNLATMLEEGGGGKDELAQALYWYSRAAEQGDEESAARIAQINRETESLTARWFRREAEQGSLRAQYGLASFYYAGETVRQDKREAAYWFRKGAEQGDAQSALRLGEMLLSGDGIRRDAEEGTRWILKAAATGHAAAQYLAGQCYLRGDGVIPDRPTALKWLKESAAQGNAEARAALARAGEP